MPVEIIESANTNLMEVHLTGKLVKEDYANFVPAVEQWLKEHGKIRMLVEMHDFHGWTGAAVWEDVKFDVKHFNDIERLAVVGESKWHHGMAVFCKPFTTAKVRYFDHNQMEDARRWLTES